MGRTAEWSASRLRMIQGEKLRLATQNRVRDRIHMYAQRVNPELEGNTILALPANEPDQIIVGPDSTIDGIIEHLVGRNRFKISK